MNIKAIGSFVKTNHSTIMVGIGLGTLVGAGIWSTAAAFKAARKIDTVVADASEEQEQVYDEETDSWVEPEKPDTSKQVRNIMIRTFAGPITLAIVGSSLIVVGTVMKNKELAQLMAKAAEGVIAEKGLEKLKEVVEEVEGPAQAKEMNEEASKRAEADLSDCDCPDPSGGKELFWEPYAGRYMYASKEKIRQTVAAMNNDFRNHDVTLSDFYGMMGMAYGEMADHVVWVYDAFDCKDLCASFHNYEADFTDRVCLVIDFGAPPMFD